MYYSLQKTEVYKEKSARGPEKTAGIFILKKVPTSSQTASTFILRSMYENLVFYVK